MATTKEQAAKAAAAAKLAKEKAAAEAAKKTPPKPAPTPPKATPTPPKQAPTPPKQAPAGPKVDPRLQAQFDAYERTGAVLTEKNKEALARQMGIDYGGSTYYSSGKPSGVKITDQFGNEVQKEYAPSAGFGFGSAAFEWPSDSGYSKNSGIGPKQTNPGSQYGWGRW